MGKQYYVGAFGPWTEKTRRGIEGAGAVIDKTAVEQYGAHRSRKTQAVVERILIAAASVADMKNMSQLGCQRRWIVGTGANLFQLALKEGDRWVSVRVRYDIDNRCHVGSKRFPQRGEKVARRFHADASAAASMGDQSMIDGRETACRRVAAKLNIFGILLVRKHAVVKDDHHDRKIHSA